MHLESSIPLQPQQKVPSFGSGVKTENVPTIQPLIKRSNTKMRSLVGGLLILFLFVGVAAAMVLVRMNQDVRQQASEVSPYSTCPSGTSEKASPGHCAQNCAGGTCVNNTAGLALCCRPPGSVCTNGNARCSGQQIQTCVSGQWESQTTCPSGTNCVSTGNTANCNSTSAICPTGTDEKPSAGYCAQNCNGTCVNDTHGSPLCCRPSETTCKTNGQSCSGNPTSCCSGLTCQSTTGGAYVCKPPVTSSCPTGTDEKPSAGYCAQNCNGTCMENTAGLFLCCKPNASVCTNGHARCSGQQVQTCVSGQWQSQPACTSGTTCVSTGTTASCAQNTTDKQCYAGYSSCSQINRYSKTGCSNCSGSYMVCCGDVIPTSAKVCTANEAQCVGTRSVKVCKSDGTGWGATTACASGLTCDAAQKKCVAVAVPAATDKQCYAGYSSCSQLNRYSKTGCSNCSGSFMVCCGDVIPTTAKVCTANEAQCVGTGSVHVCKSDGTGWGATTPCASGLTCDPAQKKCVTQTVTAPQNCSSPIGVINLSTGRYGSCGGQQATGTGSQFSMSGGNCDQGERVMYNCSAAGNLSSSCQPNGACGHEDGDAKCVGTTQYQIFNGDGQYWSMAQNCSSGFHCDATIKPIPCTGNVNIPIVGTLLVDIIDDATEDVPLLGYAADWVLQQLGYKYQLTLSLGDPITASCNRSDSGTYSQSECEANRGLVVESVGYCAANGGTVVNHPTESGYDANFYLIGYGCEMPVQETPAQETETPCYAPIQGATLTCEPHACDANYTMTELACNDYISSQDDPAVRCASAPVIGAPNRCSDVCDNEYCVCLNKDCANIGTGFIDVSTRCIARGTNCFGELVY